MSRLGMSFGGESPVVLTVPGRKSGTPRSTPVTPMTVDGETLCRRRFPRSGLGAKRPRRRRSHAAPRPQHRAGADGGTVPRGRQAAAAGVSHRGAHRCRLHEALRARQGRSAPRSSRRWPDVAPSSASTRSVIMRRLLLALAVGGRLGACTAPRPTRRRAARRAAPLPRPARRNGRSGSRRRRRSVHVVDGSSGGRRRQTRVVGVTTASGANSDVQISSASPMPLTALAIDAQQ